jgi:hypothetical protein
MSVWRVPVSIIAENRAKIYMDEFGNDLQRSLNEDTLPLFESAPFEILDWVSNNMNWRDVEKYAEKISNDIEVDYESEWSNAKKKVVE